MSYFGWRLRLDSGLFCCAWVSLVLGTSLIFFVLLGVLLCFVLGSNTSNEYPSPDTNLSSSCFHSVVDKKVSFIAKGLHGVLTTNKIQKNLNE